MSSIESAGPYAPPNSSLSVAANASQSPPAKASLIRSQALAERDGVRHF